MIVVISDLHLQHTRLDAIRRNEGARVLETQVVRNVNAGALSLLFAEIVHNVERSGATEVHLVFAGDIFELHRTPLWFVGGETRRPTLHPAADSKELEAKVHEILSAIEADNGQFFDTVRRFVQGGVTVHRGARQSLHGARVIPHFVPGNHDRLANIWPSTRARVRALLCITTADDTAPFEHQLEWNRAAGYGVRIRHGHEYDSANFPEPFDARQPSSNAAYERPVFGDFATVDIATRLAVAFRAFYACELRLPGAVGEPYRRIYAALTEFDDVRPQSMLVRYLTDYLGATKKATFEILRPVLRDVVETAKRDSFFMDQIQNLAHGAFVPAAKLIELFIEHGSPDHVAGLIALLDSIVSDPKQSGPAKHAQAELGLRTGDIFLVIAGHTHQPDHVALSGQGTLGAAGGEAYFLDTGTWRTRLDAGEGGAFGRLRGYTMVFCYHDDELGGGDGRRFEAWTGHLLAEDFGPMFSVDISALVRPQSSPPAKQTLRFLTYEAHEIDDGDTSQGAELVLFFGVDGVGQRFAVNGVHNGQLLPLGSTVLIDPALDGELWCHGIERGSGLFRHSDRALPWAVTFLPRTSTSANAPFVSGPLQLPAADSRGRACTLFCEVCEVLS